MQLEVSALTQRVKNVEARIKRSKRSNKSRKSRIMSSKKSDLELRLGGRKETKT